MPRSRWHYTNVSFFEAFASLGDDRKSDYPGAALRKQADMLDELGEKGWEVYEIKFDENGHAIYFLRLELD